MSWSLRVDANGPLDTAAIFSTLASHEIAGLTETRPDRLTHRRVLEFEGRPVILTVWFDGSGVTIEGETGDGPWPGVEPLVRHWFDLDTDIEAVDRHLGVHPQFKDQVRARPGIRVTRYPELAESAILTVLGQQISLAAARTFAGRLVAAYGEEVDGLFAFPDPARIAEEPVERLRSTIGLTGARARTISGVATLFADRRPAAGSGSDSGLLEGLNEIPGIGPWTISCVALRGLDSADELPASDAVLRRALGKASLAETLEIAEAWRPFRSYATVRLWAESVPLAG